MKKILILAILTVFSEAYARVSGPGPGWGMEIDHESLGLGGSGMISFDSNLNSMGLRSSDFTVNGFGLPNENSILNERPFRMNEFSREMTFFGR